MKRFLSWIVAAALSVVFTMASSFALSLADRLLVWLQRYSETLYWVLVVVEGLTVLGFLLFAIFASAAGVVSASDAISPSKKGARYIVIGAVFLLLSLASLALVVWGTRAGTVQGRVFPLYFVYGTWILYSVALMVTGKGSRKAA